MEPVAPATFRRAAATVCGMSTPQQPEPSPYVHSGYPNQYSAAPRPSDAAPRSGGKGLAWTAIILAFVNILSGPLLSLLISYAEQSSDMIYSSVLIVIGVIGTILGAIALRGRHKALAGIGFGSNAALLLVTVVGTIIVPTIYAVF